MSLIVIASERFAEHMTPPGHPEAPERAVVMDVVAGRWRDQGGEVVAPREATSDELLRVHAPEHVARMAANSGLAVALDPDTYTSPETYEVACLSAGAAVTGVERVLGGPHRRAFALSRPPGHHAERDRAMGFCLFNNIAVAAAHARARGIGRLAIVDYDVHHGNGTQHIFEDDPDVLYLSLHQYPYYPGTGAATEVGIGAGAGRTVNVPLAAGADDDDYRVAFEEVVLPVLHQFAPALLLVSAGFDAHLRDPLGGMRVTTDGFVAMTAALRAVADRHCDGRLVAVVEGGYDLRALRGCLEAVTDVLAPEAPAPVAWPSAGGGAARGRDAVSQARAAQRGYWTF